VPDCSHALQMTGSPAEPEGALTFVPILFRLL
jgi:hypothetical protein